MNKHSPNKLILVPSEQLSYVLGVLYGDATIYKTKQRYKNRKDYTAHMICLSVRDYEFALAFSKALSKKSWASKFSPLMAINKSPLLTFLVSIEIWFISSFKISCVHFPFVQFAISLILMLFNFFTYYAFSISSRATSLSSK